MPQTLKESFKNASNGLWLAVFQERNMKIHGIAALAALLFAGWLQIGPVKTAVVLLCIAVVMGLELMNTALEATVDLVTDEKQYALAAKAKDAAAGAVLVAAMMALGIGILFFAPPLWSRFF